MITILLPISRPHFLNEIFATLENLNCNSKDVNILTIVDGDSGLFMASRGKTQNSKFNQRLCVQFKDEDQMRQFNVSHRRHRIAKIHNFAKEHIKDSKYLWLLEDDTVFNVNTLEKLEHDYALLPFAGAISGVQMGRWGINMIGGWKVDDVYEPTEAKSVEYLEGLQEADATGFYCMLTKTELYMKHDFEPFENILGPDFDFGLKLRQQGLKNYLDFNIPTVHKTPKGDITISSTPDIATFKKIDGRWRQQSL